MNNPVNEAPEVMVNQEFAPIFRRAMQSFRALLPNELEVVHKWAHSHPRVRAQTGALENVLLNACVLVRRSMTGVAAQVVVEVFEAVMDEIVLAPDAQTLQGGLPPRRYMRLLISNSRRVGIGPLHLPVPRPLGDVKGPVKPHQLTLAQLEAIIAQHKGTVTVSSDPELGMELDIFLPAAPPLGRALVSGSGSALKHILYIDDYADMCELVGEVLPDAGFKVSCFSRASQALQSFVDEEGRYDAVVSDYNLPDFSGIELLKKIRQLQPEVTFVIMSGYVDDTLRSAAYGEGAALVLSKTNDLDDLCTALRGLLDAGPTTQPSSFTEWSSL
ncbi:MAG: response regulator [Bdellovibrionales bacterium]|nr:response regulator [Ramlibacter sp.]